MYACVSVRVRTQLAGTSRSRRTGTGQRSFGNLVLSFRFYLERPSKRRGTRSDTGNAQHPSIKQAYGCNFTIHSAHMPENIHMYKYTYMYAYTYIYIFKLMYFSISCVRVRAREYTASESIGNGLRVSVSYGEKENSIEEPETSWKGESNLDRRSEPTERNEPFLFSRRSMDERVDRSCPNRERQNQSDEPLRSVAALL